ncbi:Bobber-like protein [Thalictrum thalictroides]|uniref:Bobber-like protein n=1 Tax=Thalictrum thalictroides TaxID=46969 RepID=A0A7J6VFN2_THATH|nr:Bobber-like protein [Thalictrum thalictroides]
MFQHLQGELFDSTKADDCFWSIEDQNILDVLLTKQKQMKWWKYWVKGEPQFDTQKTEPEPSKLSDLDPETRKTVEKMMICYFGLVLYIFGDYYVCILVHVYNEAVFIVFNSMPSIIILFANQKK